MTAIEPGAGSVATGVRWGTAANLGEQVLSAGATIFLVRLLEPADLGIVAAASVALGLVALATQLGFAATVVTAPTLTAAKLATVYWSATGSVSIVAVASAGSAPLLAAGIGQPGAAPYLAALSAVLVLKVVATVPRAILQRAGRFRRMYAVQLLGALTYPAVAVSLASEDVGAWSLVIGQAVAAVVTFVAFHSAANYLPSLAFEGRFFRAHVGLGLGSLLLVLLSYSQKNADYWVVGHAGNASTLGVYYVAYVLPSILRVRLTTLVSEVYLATFAALRTDDERTAAHACAVTTTLSFVGFPMMVGLACVTPELVVLLFGRDWTAAVRPMQLICLAAVGDLITQVGYTVHYSRRLWRRVLALQALRLLIFSGFLLLAIEQEALLVAVAAAVAASTLVNTALGQLQLRRTLGRSAQVVRPLLPATVYTFGMAAVVLAVRGSGWPAQHGELLSLLIHTAVGVLVYGAMTFALFPEIGARQRRQVSTLLIGSRAAKADLLTDATDAPAGLP